MSVVREFVGRVIEIHPKFKAILEFQCDGETERALLWYDKLQINGEPLAEEGCIDNHIHSGMQLKFFSHNFDDSGVDRCRWYVTCAWPYDETERLLYTGIDTIIPGLSNYTGTIQTMAKRQGVISFSRNGNDESVVFLASKVWVDGKRVKKKAALLVVLEIGTELMFDAVPCEPSGEEGKCGWFATVVWKGRKPMMEYEDTRVSRNKQFHLLPLITEINMAISNPRSLFVHSEGQVLNIPEPDYGIALVRLQKNRWESVLFHNSSVSLCDNNLAHTDLSQIFQEGDKLMIRAALAPKKLGVQWVASQVKLLLHPSLDYLFKFQSLSSEG